MAGQKPCPIGTQVKPLPLSGTVPPRRLELRWFRKTYPSYNLQPLLLKRYQELEEARAFNFWLGEPADEAVHRQVPQLRYARAKRRGVERAADEVAQQ